jgi:hypothetical protein
MKRVKILPISGEFAENKDRAAELRQEIVFPTPESKEKLVLDFTGIIGATQSFIHALIADPIRKLGANVLELVTFKGCNDSVQGVIGIVVDYVQLNVDEDVSEVRDRRPRAAH